MKVWRIADWEPVLQLHQKNLARDVWPFIHWAADESMAYHMVTNAVNGYAANAFDSGVGPSLR